SVLRPHLAEHEPLVGVSANDALQPAHDALHHHRRVVTLLAHDGWADVRQVAVASRVAHQGRWDYRRAGAQGERRGTAGHAGSSAEERDRDTVVREWAIDKDSKALLFAQRGEHFARAVFDGDGFDAGSDTRALHTLVPASGLEGFDQGTHGAAAGGE